MPGPKFNYFTIRDELDMLTTGHIKGAASISGTTGKITTLKIGTVADDLTFASGKEMVYTNDAVHASGAYGKTPFSEVDLSGGPSGNAFGWIKVNIGDAVGYIPVYSGNAVKT